MESTVSATRHGQSPSGGIRGGPFHRTLATDLDLARLGLLGDRDPEPQHAGLVCRLYTVQVEVVTEHQLPAEVTPGAFGRQSLGVVVATGALGLDR